MRVALVQLPAAPNEPSANLAAGLDAIASAALGRADVVVFPELWLTGYGPHLDAAVDAGHPWLRAFAAAARAHGTAVLVGFLEAVPDGGPRNAAALFDRHGELRLVYAKVHTCDFDWEAALTPGEEFPVVDLDTADGPVRTGVMICYDREFPESARSLMLGGAELVLVPNACDLAGERLNQLRSRAFENMLAIATANYPAPLHDGRSCVFDGRATERPDGPARDHELFVAGDRPGIHVVDVDLPALRAYREAEAWGDSYRKPRAYRAISGTGEPAPPFRRADARR